MKELIKEAERLYKQIDEIQLDLVKCRLDVCEKRKWKAISEMETAMCGTQQFLKCLIDRKDNIVDLGEVWHSNKHIPQSNNKIIAIKSCGDTFCGICNVKNGVYLANIASDITSMSSWDDVAKWAYLEDLLPKGDNK